MTKPKVNQMYLICGGNGQRLSALVYYWPEGRPAFGRQADADGIYNTVPAYGYDRYVRTYEHAYVKKPDPDKRYSWTRVLTKCAFKKFIRDNHLCNPLVEGL